MGKDKNPQTHVLEIPVPGKKGGRRKLEFASAEDLRGWEKAYRKSKWFAPYFLVGVGINLLLYKAGLDIGRNLGLGLLVGVGVPLLTMLALTELHYHLFYKK